MAVSSKTSAAAASVASKTKSAASSGWASAKSAASHPGVIGTAKVAGCIVGAGVAYAVFATVAQKTYAAMN